MVLLPAKNRNITHYSEMAKPQDFVGILNETYLIVRKETVFFYPFLICCAKIKLSSKQNN